MFIAHVPAGYLLTRAIQRAANRPSERLMAVGLVASVIPDADLLYFYLVDHRQVHHHAYFTHLPYVWLAACWLALAGAVIMKKKSWLLGILIVLTNGLLHMVLDTMVGGIYWLMPFNDTFWYLADVPARYGWWPANFILHWTFALELLIVLAAYLQWKRR